MSLSTSRNNEIEEIYYQEKQVDLPLSTTMIDLNKQQVTGD